MIKLARPACTVSLLISSLMLVGASKAATGADASPGASNASEAESVPELTPVVVTARHIKESLQDVPDAVTAFTAKQIANAGIEHIGDFAALTPNLDFQDGSAFRAGEFNLSMRGIGNGQEGWPSVSYIVDGVPEVSTDAINSGSLEDIERIEVLRGPQSALYGFNAIAGAINVITKPPTDQWESRLRLSYGNGDDRQVGGLVSGPIIPHRLMFQLTSSYRDDDGLIRSASNGIPLDFKLQKQVGGRLIIAPSDNLTIDLRTNFDSEHNGSTYQDKLPDTSYINYFSDTDNRRALAGADNRTLYKFASKVQWDLSWLSVVSVTSYSHIDEQIFSSLCYDDPNDPVLPAPGGGAQCVYGAAYGNAATPGEAIDNYYSSVDNLRTFTQDVRFESNTKGPLEWVLGGAYLHQDYVSGFDSGQILAPNRAMNDLFSPWNDKKDDWRSVYGQVIWHVTRKLELTEAARYDDEQYNNVTYSNRSESVVVPVRSPSGAFVDAQRHSARAFQPKEQVSYHFTDDLMSYVTVSRGFRAGYYDNASYTLPEHTTNYELGLKTTFWDHRITANAAVFHIDYSNQQFSSVIDQPPYLVSTNIPKTNINGAEFESMVLASRFVRFSFGLGYLDAKVGDGTTSPAAPRVSLSGAMDMSYPVASGWNAMFHIDDRYNSSQYLFTGNDQLVPPKNFVNVRTGFQNARYDIAAFVRNATDEREATFAGAETFAGGYVRYLNEPRSYGVEIRVSF